ncbi:hypothetical protein IU501_34765 [Nocardia otitidiscaviarum]|uniref:hypothetical protein n=1 Tax=Nocardia otitidiscaviarum TaxID=1823 RepID=UPI00189353AE|nr:hypothetical protein [Nocardia otitidiscaviarum]MBF6138134.1 hypothetical protein [Nocardia otitidiscaviarum]
MPIGVNVLIDGPLAEVEVLDPQLRRQVAARLIAAARPRAWLVDTVTVGRPCPTFRAPVEIVDAAGLIDHPSDALSDARTRAEHAHADLTAAHEQTRTELEELRSELSAPPRTGRGSGTEAWQRFLTETGITWEATDSRADLIARWDNHPAGRT